VSDAGAKRRSLRDRDAASHPQAPAPGRFPADLELIPGFGFRHAAD
jgi:hypothetical protein